MVTGFGTVTVDSGRLWVKALAFSAADNATATLTTLVGSTATSCYKFKINSNDADASMFPVYFGEKGVPMTGLAVTLENDEDILYIFIK